MALAFQALLVLQVHCAAKKTASSEPKVTSQVRPYFSRSPALLGRVPNILLHMQVFFDIEIDNKPAGRLLNCFLCGQV